MRPERFPFVRMISFLDKSMLPKSFGVSFLMFRPDTELRLLAEPPNTELRRVSAPPNTELLLVSEPPNTELLLVSEPPNTELRRVSPPPKSPLLAVLGLEFDLDQSATEDFRLLVCEPDLSSLCTFPRLDLETASSTSFLNPVNL